jgi:L-threonylcarbamoyladenylate synthase
VTDVIRVDPENPDAEAIARAARCLRDGGLVAFPTETVYGLGVHALDRAAVRRLFEAKERPATDPLIVHVASSDLLLSRVAELAQGGTMSAWFTGFGGIVTPTADGHSQQERAAATQN